MKSRETHSNKMAEGGLENKPPINIPSYDDVLEYSNLSESVFDKKDYREYVESFKERTNLIKEQEQIFTEQLKSLKKYYERGSEIFKKHFDLVEDLLSDFSKSINSMMNQKDLAPSSEDWFLVEDQVDHLANQARDLKFAISNLLSIGGFQSVSIKSSKGEQIGPGQLSETELGAVYARSDISPRSTESHYDAMIEMSENAENETLLMGSGMSALTVGLGLTKSELPDAQYLIGDNLYFENDRYLEQLASEVGIDNMDLFSDNEDMKEQLKDDPQVILTEPVGNTPEMVVTDIEEIVKTPTDHEQRFVLVDYTLTGPNYDFSEITEKLDDKTVLILFSSLQKMHEEGDDIAPAGMITAVAKDGQQTEKLTKKMRGLRSILGANITSQSLSLLQNTSPESTREYAEKIQNNVKELSSFIESLGTNIIDKVVTPPLDKNGNSQGALFYLHFTEKVGTDFIDKLIEKAKSKNLQVVDGSSFGFRDSRLTTLQEDKVVRFSPGIENPRKLEKMKQIIEEALNELED